MEEKEKLKELIRDLLDEFRIDEKCLHIMANGYSPNGRGAIDCMVGEEYYFPHPVIQL